MYLLLKIRFQVIQFVTDLDPLFGGHQQPFKGSLNNLTIPKRSPATQNYQVMFRLAILVFGGRESRIQPAGTEGTSRLFVVGFPVGRLLCKLFAFLFRDLSTNKGNGETPRGATTFRLHFVLQRKPGPYVFYSKIGPTPKKKND